MTRKEYQSLLLRFTVFLILATVFQFTNFGSIFLSGVGLEDLADKVKLHKAHAADTRIFLTSTASTTWTVPADWNNSSNTIEVIGGGGGGDNSSLGEAGGGGGAYAKISNFNVGASTTILIQVGAGGAQTASGTLSFWGGSGAVTTCTGKSVCAAFGGAGFTGTNVGIGGTTANSSGTVKYAGGNGGTGNTTGDTGGGGGGAGGPLGAGAAGGNGGATTSDGGGGGGGSGGSGAGGIGQNASSSGGRGGNGPGGSGSGAGGTGAGGTAATAASGGGGGGGDQDFSGAAGATYTEWDSTHGSGGGGGAGSDLGNGGAGALYGGGGGGSDAAGGAGANGIIVITYTPVPLPDGTSVTYTIGGDGAKSGDSATITGTTFGTVAAGSRANCSGGSGTGCVKFVVGGNTTVADAHVTAWSDTSITFTVSSTLVTLGGAASLQVCGAGVCDSTPLTFHIYPNITSMATCTDCSTNAGREYSTNDTDGLIYLTGDHFHLAAATGTINFTGDFGNVTGTIHNVAEGPCTAAGWKGSIMVGTVCVEVAPGISDSINSGSVLLTRDAASGTINIWPTATALPVARYSHTSIVNNGYVYAIGGYDNTSVTTSSVVYAPINSTGSIGDWATATAMPAPRGYHASIVNNGYVYAMGGIVGATATSSVLYAPINSTGSIGAWITATALPANRRAHTSIVNNGYVYAVGGVFDATATSSVLYAPINSTGSIGAWATATALPVAISAHTSIVNNGYIYAIGGIGAAATSSVLYAPINSTGSIGAWITATALPAERYSHTSIVNNGYVYAMGGVDVGGNAISSVVYAPINANGSIGAWATATALPNVRNSHTSIVNNGYVYAIGGSDIDGFAISSVVYAALGKPDALGLTALPRILTNTPTSTSTGNIVQILGNHFCQAGTCPSASSSMITSTDNVKFGSTTSTANDFVSKTGGSGTCDGTGYAWSHTEICVKVPSATPAGSASTTITSNTLYQSNAKAFNVSSSAATPGTPGTPTYANVSTSTLTINYASSTNTDYYKIERATSSQTYAQITTTTALTYGDTGRTPNTTYFYRLRGTNSGGDGPYSATSSVLMFPDKPGTPTYTNISSSTLTVNWTDAPGGASSTKIERATSTQVYAQVSTTTVLSYPDSGLATSTTYYYRVRATNSTGDSVYSATSSVITTSGSGFVASGTLVSLIIDTAVTNGVAPNSIFWEGSQPASTDVKFQFAASNSTSGPWTYVGWNAATNSCDESSYYNPGAPATPVEIKAQCHRNKRYIRYKIYLSTSNSASTPRVDRIILNYAQ